MHPTDAIPPASAPTPEFDLVEARKQMAEAPNAVIAMAKAQRAAAQSASARRFAVESIRAMESVIRDALEAGATIEAVQALIIAAVPAVPAEHIRHAISLLRDRSRDRGRARAPAATEPATAAAKPAAAVPSPRKVPDAPAKHAAPAAPTPAADVMAPTDRRPDESLEDYQLRKRLEGPADAAVKAIGPHNT